MIDNHFQGPTNTQDDTAEEMKPRTRVEHFLNKIANSISGESEDSGSGGNGKALTLYVEDGHVYKDKLCTETYASYEEACEALLAAGSNIQIIHVEGDEGDISFATGIYMHEDTEVADVSYIRASGGALTMYTVYLFQSNSGGSGRK